MPTSSACKKRNSRPNKWNRTRALTPSAADDAGSGNWACNDGREGQRAGFEWCGDVLYCNKGVCRKSVGAAAGEKTMMRAAMCPHGPRHFCFLQRLRAQQVRWQDASRTSVRWLTALRRSMAAERQRGKHVLLAGDLDCAVSPKDRCFLHRGLDASSLKQAAQLVA